MRRTRAAFFSLLKLKLRELSGFVPRGGNERPIKEIVAINSELLTDIAGRSGPAGSTLTGKRPAVNQAGTSVLTRSWSARVIDYLAVHSRKAVGASALVGVGSGVFACPAVQTRFVRAAII